MNPGSFSLAGNRGEARVAWLMVTPALLGLFLFVAVPFVLAVVISLTNLRLGAPLPLEFVGLRQYFRILGDPAFLRALWNNSLFALIVVPVQTSLALALAILLNRKLRGMVLFRALFFMPVVFPLSLVAVVWILIFAPGANGMMNAFLSRISLGAWSAHDFLRDPHFALPAIMLTSIWQGTGFQMVILLAGLQSIPQQLYDAAQIDGANDWRRFWHITLPQLRNPLTFVVIVTSILSFRVFDQVRVMTQGGPANSSTTVIFEAVRSAFDRAEVARGAAMTVVFFALVLTLTLLLRRVFKQEGELS